MRHDAKRDLNEKAIVAALESVGCSVRRLSAEDLPDLLVGRLGKTYLMEIKSEKGKLSEGQKEFHATWKGICHVVRDIKSALAIVGIGVSDHRNDSDRMSIAEYKDFLLKERAGLK